MILSELIAKLQTLPPDLTVVISNINNEAIQINDACITHIDDKNILYVDRPSDIETIHVVCIK
jgi:hypothetical protein